MVIFRDKLANIQQTETLAELEDELGRLSTKPSYDIIPSVHCSTEQLLKQETIPSSPDSLSYDKYMPEFCVVFTEHDPENAQNWSTWYQVYAVVAITYSAWATVLYSTCYSSGIPDMMADLKIPNETVANLGISLYLLGWSIGSLVLAPLGETVGRRPVYTMALLLFIGLIPAAALANSFVVILIVRVLGSIVGGVMVSIAPGSLVDIVPASHTALAMSFYSFGTLNGPVTGPIIGGFVTKRWGWRGDGWFIMIASGVGLIMMSLVRESYPPVILRRRAAKIREQTRDPRWWSEYDECEIPLHRRLFTALWRPIKLCITEPVLWFWNFYISVIYAILYLCVVSYPIIFQIRQWSPDISGLAFLGVFIGNTLAVLGEPLFRQLVNLHPVDMRTGKRAPEASVLVIIIAAVVAPVGQLVFALTSLPASVPWIASMTGAVLFGFGNTIIFTYGTNYVAVSYGIYASSALVSNSVCRSLLAAGLVEVGQRFYSDLTPRVAGIVLAGAEFAIIPIPILFYIRGHKVRLRSKALGKQSASHA
ncbi:Cycloheximide resistance protein [Talaromyces islandicus]|uniref:Cycloheximide resistance protein n=1 Tax=Talaromyces islandicus TaxID=28573 RepID=A0A0U1MAS5_TALIS|nr:Cycloheximide resistance protein [Talaromyces islandicus]